MKQQKQKTIKVSAIVLTIGGKEISLTPEEARELKLQLENTLGRNDVVYRDRYVERYPTWPYTQPVISYGNNTITDYAIPAKVSL